MTYHPWEKWDRETQEQMLEDLLLHGSARAGLVEEGLQIIESDQNTMSDKPEVGDIVETESGEQYPVVGTEQGGRTLLLPTGPGTGEIDFATREFWPDEVDVVVEDPSVWEIYRRGMQRGLTPGETNMVNDGLEEGKTLHAKHILRVRTGSESPYEWKHGHLIEDGECAVEGCQIEVDGELEPGSLPEIQVRHADCPATEDRLQDIRQSYRDRHAE
jgi:hypothetical protein